MERKRLKNVPRSAWLVVGVCIAAVVMPTAAVATALTYTGIEGNEPQQGRCLDRRPSADRAGNTVELLRDWPSEPDGRCDSCRHSTSR